MNDQDSVNSGTEHPSGERIESPRPALDGNDLLMQERWRQKTEEGWTEEHDEEHENGELTQAANGYRKLGNGSLREFAPDADQSDSPMPMDWPWAKQWWKPKTRLRNLVRAGALYQAEIDRLRRQRSQVAQEIDRLLATVNDTAREAETTTTD